MWIPLFLVLSTYQFLLDIMSLLIYFKTKHDISFKNFISYLSTHIASKAFLVKLSLLDMIVIIVKILIMKD